MNEAEIEYALAAFLTSELEPAYDILEALQDNFAFWARNYKGPTEHWKFVEEADESDQPLYLEPNSPEEQLIKDFWENYHRSYIEQPNSELLTAIFEGAIIGEWSDEVDTWWGKLIEKRAQQQEKRELEKQQQEQERIQRNSNSKRLRLLREILIIQERNKYLTKREFLLYLNDKLAEDLVDEIVRLRREEALDK